MNLTPGVLSRILILSFSHFRKLREKEAASSKLEEELKKKLEEKSEAAQFELAQQNQELAKAIEEKESEREQLRKELESIRHGRKNQDDEAVKSKQEALSNIAQVMESELQCSICNELLVKATSLGCAHSFCALCIEQWMRVKKVCPVCRAAITSKMHAVALDSYIERMLEELSPEVVEKRKILVAERKSNNCGYTTIVPPIWLRYNICFYLSGNGGTFA